MTPTELYPGALPVIPLEAWGVRHAAHRCEPFRYATQSVRVCPLGLIATDGKMLAIYRLPLDTPPRTLALDPLTAALRAAVSQRAALRKAHAAARKGVKARHRAEILARHEAEEQAVQVDISLPECEGHFPPVEEVLPKPEDYTLEPLNIVTLERVAATLDAWGAKCARWEPVPRDYSATVTASSDTDGRLTMTVPLDMQHVSDNLQVGLDPRLLLRAVRILRECAPGAPVLWSFHARRPSECTMLLQAGPVQVVIAPVRLS